MKKKFIFLAMMLFALLGGVNNLGAQETIAVGTTSISSLYLPTYIYYGCTYSQQIYVAGVDFELGSASITKVAFMKSGTQTVTRNMRVYMKNIGDKAKFESVTDWISVDETNLVYEGAIEYTGGTGTMITIPFNNKFDYAGGNILLCVEDYTGSYLNSYPKHYAFNTNEARALVYYNDNQSTPSGQATKILNNLNYVQFTYEPAGDDLIPAVPTNLQADVVDYQSINLTWNEAENALNYQVYNGEEKIAETDQTEYLVEGLDDNTEFCFTVKSVRYNNNVSDASEQVCATTEVLPVPATPTNLIATSVKHNSVTLTWDAVEYATSYTITYENGMTTTTEPTYVVTGLTPETLYTFSVKAVNVKGESSPAEVSVTTLEYINPFAGKQYRIKVNNGTYAGYYLNINSNTSPGTFDYPTWSYITDSQVGVATESDSYGQIFTIEDDGDGHYYLKSADGYYIKCDNRDNVYNGNWWSVYAYSNTEKTPLEFEYSEGEKFYIRDYDKMTGNSVTLNNDPANSYFKVNSNSLVYCDAAISVSEVVLWTVEQVALSVTATADKDYIYDDETTTLRANVMAASGDVTYSWTLNGELVGTEKTFTFTPEAIGEYTFTCTATDSENAIATDEVTVYVDARPTLTLTVEAEKELIYNDGETTTLTANVVEGTGYAPYSYSWTLDGETIEDATAETYAFSNETVGEYTLACTVTDSRSNIVTDSKTITVKDLSEKPLVIELGTESTNTYGFLPTYTYYNYSLTQQIYTQSEINMSNNVVITSIAFKESAGVETTRNFSIYMQNTSETTCNTSSFIIQDKACFEGNVTFKPYEWVEITLETPFEYDATKNILLCVDDNTGSFINNRSFATYNTTTEKSNYIYNDNTNYDPLTSSYGCYTVGQKNSIKLGYELPAPKPENLVADKEAIYPNESVTITWNEFDGALSYNVYVNGELDGNTETPSYELSGLPYNMTEGNAITVAAVLDETGTESAMSKPVYVKVAGTFTLTVNVTDGTNPIEGATVEIDMTYAYDEFFNKLEMEVEPLTTNAQGVANVSLPLLAKYYDEYDGMWMTPRYIVKASNVPYSDAETEVYCADIDNLQTIQITLPLLLPQVDYIQVQDEEENNLDGDILEGTNIVLSWDAVEGADSYKVYTLVEDVEIKSETTIDPKYFVEGVEKGYRYAVSALFGDLESEKCYASLTVKGNGYFKGYVTDGTNASLQGIQVKVSSEYGDVSAVATTNKDGYFIGEIMEGENYKLTISHSDYEEYILENITIIYNTASELGTIQLTAKPSASGITEVTATLNGENVVVNWTVDEAYTKYNVYRRLAGTQGKGDNIAQDVAVTSYTDAQWETLEPGTYQYGVAALVEPQAQTRGTEVIFEEGFENNGTNIPTGWTKSGSAGVLDANGYYNSGTYGCYLGGTTTNSTLTSPEIDLTSYSSATWSFYYWSDSDLSVKIKVKDGEWNLIQTYPYRTTFEKIEIALSEDYVGKVIQIQFEHKTAWTYTCLDDILIVSESSETETQIVWSNDVVKQGPATFIGGDTENPTAWNVDANWSTGSVPADGAEVTINANAVITSEVNVASITINKGDSYPYNTLTVADKGILTVTGTISQQSDYLLVLEEGGQIFQNNANVTARFRMSIDNPSDWSDETNKDGWQFISMPMTGVDFYGFASTWNSSTAQPTCDYDLYKYDGSQEKEWQNFRDGGFEEDTFKSGTGYLASRKEVSTVSLSGTLNVETPFAFSGYDQIIYNEEKDLANFRLFGNPFTYDIYMSDFDLDLYNDGENDFVSGYAVVNNSGSYDYRTIEPIKVGEGFFVKALTTTAIAYAPASKRSENKSNNSLNITATGNAGEDNVIINLAGNSEGFNKLQNFNDAIATVYVAEDGKNYGIYNCDADVQEIELNFNANQMGNYTISIEPNGKFQTVTLVDRFTGIETNMLVEDYHFTAMSNVNNNRFIVKLAVSDQQSAVSDNFVYQSGEDLIIDAEGTVQIIDVMGRVLLSDEVESTNNRINVSGFRNGTYMVRVINGSEVKVEKVVIY